MRELCMLNAIFERPCLVKANSHVIRSCEYWSSLKVYHNDGVESPPDRPKCLP